MKWDEFYKLANKTQEGPSFEDISSLEEVGTKEELKLLLMDLPGEKMQYFIEKLLSLGANFTASDIVRFSDYSDFPDTCVNMLVEDAMAKGVLFSSKNICDMYFDDEANREALIRKCVEKGVEFDVKSISQLGDAGANEESIGYLLDLAMEKGEPVTAKDIEQLVDYTDDAHLERIACYSLEKGFITKGKDIIELTDFVSSEKEEALFSAACEKGVIFSAKELLSLGFLSEELTSKLVLNSLSAGTKFTPKQIVSLYEVTDEKTLEKVYDKFISDGGTFPFSDIRELEYVDCDLYEKALKTAMENGLKLTQAQIREVSELVDNDTLCKVLNKAMEDGIEFPAKDIVNYVEYYVDNDMAQKLVDYGRAHGTVFKKSEIQTLLDCGCELKAESQEIIDEIGKKGKDLTDRDIETISEYGKEEEASSAILYSIAQGKLYTVEDLIEYSETYNDMDLEKVLQCSMDNGIQVTSSDIKDLSEYVSEEILRKVIGYAKRRGTSISNMDLIEICENSESQEDMADLLLMNSERGRNLKFNEIKYIAENCDDRVCEKVLRSIMEAGGYFTAKQVMELSEAVDSKLMTDVMAHSFKNNVHFTETQLQDLKYSVDDELLYQIDKKQNTHAFDEEDEEEYDDSYDYADTSGKKPGLLGHLGALFVASEIVKKAGGRKASQDKYRSWSSKPRKFHIGERVNVRRYGKLVSGTIEDLDLNGGYSIDLDDGIYLQGVRESDIVKKGLFG